MAVSTPDPCASVLHVCTGPPQHVQAMDDMLRSASLDVMSVGDVYRALARLCRDERNAFGGVVVCVDGLAPEELEFFSIVSRVCPGLAAYAYGSDRSEWRMAKACDLGAHGTTAEEVIPALMSTRPGDATVTVPQHAEVTPATGPTPGVAGTDAAAEIPASAETPSGEPSPAAAVTPDPLPAHRQEKTDAPDDDRTSVEGDADEPSSSSVRVPWLRYGERPLRTAPGSKPRPDKTAAGPERPSPVITPHQPLLTDEELKALMSNDGAPADSGEGNLRGPGGAAGEGGV